MDAWRRSFEFITAVLPAFVAEKHGAAECCQYCCAGNHNTPLHEELVIYCFYFLVWWRLPYAAQRTVCQSHAFIALGSSHLFVQLLQFCQLIEEVFSWFYFKIVFQFLCVEDSLLGFQLRCEAATFLISQNLDFLHFCLSFFTFPLVTFLQNFEFNIERGNQLGSIAIDFLKLILFSFQLVFQLEFFLGILVPQLGKVFIPTEPLINLQNLPSSAFHPVLPVPAKWIAVVP